VGRGRGGGLVVRVAIDGAARTLGPDESLVFGRADDLQKGVVGLDASDMGISAQAGSVHYAWDVWWVENRSSKRRLLVEEDGSPTHHTLAPGHRYAVARARAVVLVPGAVYTHRIEIAPEEAYLERLRANPAMSTGTLVGDDVRLSDRDRLALAAMFEGFLVSFPRRNPHPVTYAEAAERLGPPWDKTKVRKQIERVRERLAHAGLYFDGPRANYDLAEHLIGNGLLRPDDVEALPDRAR
jgi:hypothetical protein